MQQPIRYYITKSGDEPTVRSVRVAREEPRLKDRDDLASKHGADATSASVSPEVSGRRQGVKRLVQSAIRRRGQAA